MFASVRQAAGTGRAEVPGATVGEVLAHASERFGPAFVEQLSCCRIWRNGEPADEDTPVAAGDEVALLPPVSGG